MKVCRCMWKCAAAVTLQFSCMVLQLPVGLGLLYEVPRSHSGTPYSVGLLWKSDQPEAENSDCKKHSQETDTYAAGGIRTHIPCKLAATKLRLRPHGH